MQDDLRPLISVVIPTRGRADLLMNRSLPSILSQWYSPLEVVVVVDGPDPETERVLNDAAARDERIRPVFLPRNMGGSDARNAGVQAARGEWIAFLDDDDELLPHNLEQHLIVGQRAQQEGQRWPVSVCGAITRTPLNDTFNPPRLPDPGEHLGDYLLSRRSARERECGFMTSAIFCRRELLLHHPFRSGLPRHQDWDWVLRVNAVPEVRFYFTQQIATIWYYGEHRKQLSNATNWEQSLQWILGIHGSGLVSDRALAGFLNRSVADYAKRSGSYRAIVPLARLLLTTRPRAFEWMIFLLIWVTPEWLRVVIRRRRAHNAGAAPANPPSALPPAGSRPAVYLPIHKPSNSAE